MTSVKLFLTDSTMNNIKTIQDMFHLSNEESVITQSVNLSLNIYRALKAGDKVFIRRALNNNIDSITLNIKE